MPGSSPGMTSVFVPPCSNTASRSRRGFRANAIKMSLPGLTRQSICFEKALAKEIDARVKPGHDECFCAALFKHSFAISPHLSCKCHQDVIAGLDPAIHLLRES